MTTADRLAAALLQARRQERAPLRPFAADLHPTTLADGIAGQLALARLLDATPPAGFKIGATARRMQEFLGLAGPAASFLAAQSLQASGSTLPFDRYFRAGIECELAVRLARDLPPGPCSPEQAQDAVDRLLPAIEIVENRYQDLVAFGAPAMVADQVFHAAAVIGEADADWRGLDLEAIEGSMLVDGAVVGGGFGRELLGGPFRALAWLAQSHEVVAFGGLRAGQLIMLGSVCPTIWLDRPGQVEVRFPPLGHASVTLA